MSLFYHLWFSLGAYLPISALVFFNCCFSLIRTFIVVVSFWYIPQGEFSQLGFPSQLSPGFGWRPVGRFSWKEQDKGNISIIHRKASELSFITFFLQYHFLLRDGKRERVFLNARSHLLAAYIFSHHFTSNHCKIHIHKLAKMDLSPCPWNECLYVFYCT